MKKMFLHKLFDIGKIKHYVVKFFDKQQYYLFLCTTVVHYFLFKKKNTNLFMLENYQFRKYCKKI